jgi:hypothetical protein
MRKTKAELQTEKDLDWLTDDSRGRRILWRLFSQAGTLGGYGRLDHASLAFKAGQRDLVQPIFAVLVSNWPPRLTALLTENQRDSAASDNGTSSDADSAGESDRAGYDSDR